MQFSEIVGQSEIKKKLINSIQHGRMPHAQLFVEKEGYGALALAWATAQYLMCENPSAEDSCGKCSQCKKNAGMIHPDLHWSFPIVVNKEKKKETASDYITLFRSSCIKNPYITPFSWLEQLSDGENKQGNIPIKECGEILKKLSFTTFENENKILIIWIAEYLGKEGNSLLKFIEEPPANTFLILITHDEDLILNTILSRCQTLRIPKINDQFIKEFIVQKQAVHEDKAIQLTRQANGSMSVLYELEKQDWSDDFELLHHWLQACYNKSDGIFLISEKLSKKLKEEQKNFLLFVLDFFQEYLMFYFGNEKIVRLSQREIEVSSAFLNFIQVEKVIEISQILEHAIMAIERNAHSKTLFLNTSLKIKNVLVQNENY